MEFFYFKKNKLKKLFSDKCFVDETPLHERLKIANRLVETYCSTKGINSLEPAELVIALQLFLFNYYLNYVSCLYAIVKNNDLTGRNIILIRNGFKRLYQFESIREIVLPTRHSLSKILKSVLILFKSISGALGRIGFKDKADEMTDILVLPVGSGGLERGIWHEITPFIDCSYKIKRFPGIMPRIPYWFSGQRDEIIKRFKRDLKNFSNLIPSTILQIFKFQFYNYYQFLLLNPYKMIVTFEQSSPNAAIIAYTARLMQKISISLAHAPTFGEHCKHNSSQYCLLFGKSSQESFERRDSIDCGEVIAIGAPNSDFPFQKEIKNKPWNNDVLFLPIYVKPGRDFEQDMTFDVIQKFIETFPEIKLTVKPHPAQKNPYIQKYLSAYSNVNILKERADLSEQIDNHDVTIIVGWSAGGLDVIIREKPLIRLNLFNIDDWFGYTKSGYAIDATNYEELCKAFKHLRANPAVNLSARKKLLDLHFNNHGFAAKKTAQFFETVLSEIIYDSHSQLQARKFRINR